MVEIRCYTEVFIPLGLNTFIKESILTNNQ